MTRYQSVCRQAIAVIVTILSAYTFLLLSTQARAETNNWNERLVEEGIRVVSRPVPDSRYEEFRATMEVEGTLAQAVALLQDNSACTRWLFRCQESRVLKQVSQTERYFYQVTSLPFPAKSRDSIFNAKINYNPDQSITIKLQSASDYLEETKHVRVSEARGEYRLVPIDARHFRLTWQQYVDPAGALPAWLVNSLLTDLPFKSLRAFRTLIREKPYIDAKFEFDTDGVPNSIMTTQ